jgi:DNA-binding CsgD family transcriptional regulator
MEMASNSGKRSESGPARVRSLPAASVVADAVHALDAFAGATLAVGTQHFEDALLDALQLLVRVDHLTVLAHRPAEGLRMLGVASRTDLSVARSLTRDYVATHHVLDPNYAELARGAGRRRVIVRRHDPARLKTRPYQERFYTTVGIVDKVSYIWHAGDVGYYVNFYRTTRCGLFMPDDVATLAALATMIAALIRLHDGRRLVQSALADGAAPADRIVALLGANLTRRESAVLVRILTGMRTEGIAIDLGIKPASVITFRKRAYAKLGIATQAELFASCLRVLPRLLQ